MTTCNNCKLYFNDSEGFNSDMWYHQKCKAQKTLSNNTFDGGKITTYGDCRTLNSNLDCKEFKKK